MKKKSNNLIFIFVLLVILPSIFVVPVVNIILKNTGINNFLNNSKYAFLSSLFSSISVIFGIIVVYRQIQKQKKIMSNRFLIDLNDYFVKDENIQRVFGKLIKLEDKKYSSNSYNKLFQTDEAKYDLLEYLNFMESLQYFVDERVIKISEINELFSKRFFIAINNPYIQEIKLIKYDYSWVNLYRLSKSLIEYKKEHNNPMPYELFSIEKTPNYEKYSKGYYNYKSIKSNYFKIFIFSASFFIVSIFLINYFILGIDAKGISRVISIIGVIIGALSLLFQTIETNNINRCRFLFDLNKKFMTNDCFSYIFIKASNNLYNNKNIKSCFKKSDEIFIKFYLNFFEVIYILYKKNIITIQEINFLFNGRIFRVFGNPEIQKSFIYRDKESYKNIFLLYKKLYEFRIKNKLYCVYPVEKKLKY